MKKIVAIITAVLLVAAFIAVPASASYYGRNCCSSRGNNCQVRNQLISAAEDALPDSFEAYRVQLDHILSQVNVTQRQADQIVQIMEKGKQSVSDEGTSLQYYSQEERQTLVQCIGEVCRTLNLRYTVTMKKCGAMHRNDAYMTIYACNGRRLCVLDGDGVKETDSADVSSTQETTTGSTAAPWFLSGSMVCLLAGAAWIAKKALMH